MSFSAYINATDHDNDVLGARLAAAGSLDERIVLITENARGRVAFSTSLGIEDQVILHAIATTRAPVDVFTLDTGRLFPETLDTIAASEQRYGLKIRVVAPDPLELERLVARDGIHGFRFSKAARTSCCEVRKVVPLRRALDGAHSWITGLRREQSAGRSDVPFTVRDWSYGVLKINPLADWSLARLEDYVATNDVPVNALHGKGFPSIGCQPCTRAVLPGEDIRAGRWWWENPDHKECGLHTRAQPAEAAE
ncbi:MAG: phosphoadenylyl-sulfate reductase [Hyphomicrobiaceae bacterium]|nr:phosphoadenylyl-sulfate reductase [Hyphomicrobiaceae bacterium]